MEITPNLSEKALRDYELVCRARDKGDQKAFAALMDLYREPLYYMLLKMTNSSIEADDLTIEAFGKAFKAIDNYTPDYAFSTWLFRIASNNCIDHIRKKRAATVSIDNLYTNVEGEIVGINVISDALDPESNVIVQQRNDMMRAVVKKLKPHYKVLVEKRYFEEKSYEEIASELDMPIGTVKAKLFRAREFLYDILKNLEDFAK
ncbi:MAG TPA: sigma-70 family RNA polymerase sigma factor [Candidatus Onthomorpha intestinigallinarum]|uniref:Sigma-70 family RNA polymerase sigma factor n=1 Tax=Candidatus Onthomorpha intestinigallinarum TaxID=2840880 RepID=A0A9D1RI39_9BACT|nr:sigma-70 family RNA polymerase sigma factor [Candidatus Onthomorpha intestinigallinarum]